MGCFFKGLGILFASVGGLFLAAFSAHWAVKSVRIYRIDLWGYDYFLGAGVGLLIQLILCCCFAFRKRMVLSHVSSSLLLIPAFFTTVGFAALAFFGETLPQKRYQAEYQKVQSRIQHNSAFFALVDKAKTGDLSKVERQILMSSLLYSNRIKTNDFMCLASRFVDDRNFAYHLAIKLQREASSINENLLRRIYDSGKLMNGSDLMYQYATWDGTSDDILQDLIEHNTRYPFATKYSASLMRAAEQTLFCHRLLQAPELLDQILGKMKNGSINKDESGALQRLVRTGKMPNERRAECISQYMNDTHFIDSLFLGAGLSANDVRLIYDEQVKLALDNPATFCSVANRMAVFSNTPPDVLTLLVNPEPPEIRNLPNYSWVIQKAKNRILISR